MNETFDAVFSVRELRRILKAAEASQKAHKAKTTHCIVLRGLKLNPPISNPRPILCTVSVEMARHNLEKSTAEFLSVVRDGGDK